MDFASPVASRIAGEPTDSFSTGKTFATWTFNKAKNPFATKRQPFDFMRVRSSMQSDTDTAVRYREHHHPSASGEGLRP
ncbi:MAG: hypothetical protein ABEJ05_08610 [Haloglomus sp.]